MTRPNKSLNAEWTYRCGLQGVAFILCNMDKVDGLTDCTNFF